MLIVDKTKKDEQKREHLKTLQKRTAKPSEVSIIYGMDTGTLANLRSQKKGPRYYKQGRGVFYFLDDVEAWLRQNPVETIDSLSER